MLGYVVRTIGILTGIYIAEVCVKLCACVYIYIYIYSLDLWLYAYTESERVHKEYSKSTKNAN